MANVPKIPTGRNVVNFISYTRCARENRPATLAFLLYRHDEIPHHASVGDVRIADAFRATCAIPSVTCYSSKASSKHRWVMRRCGKAVVETIHSCIVGGGFEILDSKSSVLEQF